MSVSRDLVAGYFRAVNDEDWAAMATLLHPKAAFSTPGARPREGRSDVLELFGKIFTRWDTHLDTVRWQIQEGPKGVVAIDFEGRTSSGVEVSFAALDVFDFEDDLIRGIATWYDSAKVAGLMSAGSVS